MGLAPEFKEEINAFFNKLGDVGSEDLSQDSEVGYDSDQEQPIGEVFEKMAISEKAVINPHFAERLNHYNKYEVEI
mgnify:CR=1 FL=1